MNNNRVVDTQTNEDMVVGSHRRDAGSQHNNENIGSQYSGTLDNIDGLLQHLSNSGKCKFPSQRQSTSPLVTSPENITQLALREYRPYSKIFWSLFSCIRTEYGKIGVQSECEKILPEKLRIQTLNT